MNGVVPNVGPGHVAAFLRASGRYWTRVFPNVGHELRRRRESALDIPDPVLRRIALQALECKRPNVEGAAAFELLAPKRVRASLVRALAACQTMCDYLDLLAEQPAADPIANGRNLHEALTVALTPGMAHCDYYARHAHCEDGGYLKALVDDIQQVVANLPALASIREPLRRCAERIVSYQAFNHGDALGSYADFQRWASTQGTPADGLSWWELGAAAGSTLTAFALIASATDSRLDAAEAQAIESVYFPWIGALHTMLDSLIDRHEDVFTGKRGLIGCYSSAEHASLCMRTIVGEALTRIQMLRAGPRHRLLLIAMTAFYLCEARRRSDEHVEAVAPPLLQAAGRLTKPAMLMLSTRLRAAKRSTRQAALFAAAK